MKYHKWVFLVTQSYFDAWEERHVLRNGHNLFVVMLHAMLVSKGTLINLLKIGARQD